MTLKSSLARSVGHLLGVKKNTDLSLRGDSQYVTPPPPELRFAMFGGGGSGGAWTAGGGGGGGYIEESVAIDTGATYTVTIGGGGSAPGPAPPHLPETARPDLRRRFPGPA